MAFGYHMSCHRNHKWLRNVITGDEKWVLYINSTRRRQWLSVGQTGVATPKTDLHPKEVMLSVWWVVKGVIHWQTLANGCTITADLYFLHDNAIPHVAKSTREKLLKLGWVTIPRPPYSPDLAPTDYHLFRSLSNHLREKKLDGFFRQMSLDFYEHRILSLLSLSQYVSCFNYVCK